MRTQARTRLGPGIHGAPVRSNWNEKPVGMPWQRCCGRTNKALYPQRTIIPRRWSRIPGGTFRMGSDKHYPEEAPSHRVSVDGFWMDRTPVTNRQFKQFVMATGHVTTAEIPRDPKDCSPALAYTLSVGSLVFTRPRSTFDLCDWSQWWSFTASADWRHPYGPRSDVILLDDYPVVHVSFSMRLPMPVGRARICRRKRNGNSPRAVDWRAPSSPGAMSLHRAAATWPTPGRATFRATITTRMVTAHLAGDGLSAQSVRPVRHDRQCLGVDRRLVFAEPRGRCAEGLLHPPTIRVAAARMAVTIPPTQRHGLPQGAEGRLASVRPQLLPPLPAGGAARRAGRYVGLPCRLQVRRRESARGLISAPGSSPLVMIRASSRFDCIGRQCILRRCIRAYAIFSGERNSPG